MLGGRISMGSDKSIETGNSLRDLESRKLKIFYEMEEYRTQLKDSPEDAYARTKLEKLREDMNKLDRMIEKKTFEE